MIVEWDDEKAAKNLDGHGISFDEAVTVLADPLSTTYRDPDHSVDEYRFITIGQSSSGRILVVAHTDRADAVRLISARRATRAERKWHEETKPSRT